MKYPKIPLAQSIIEIFRTKGIQNIVLSPGSRNAPLTLGFASQTYFKCYSIVDERSAAFFALGLAQQIQQPVAVVCTSGSALLNYYPAFAEAFYSQIPFVVVSADRPPHKIDIGDGQTIRQENVFANHSLYNANLSECASEANDKLIQEALSIAKTQNGPVHINVPFEEPLYEMVNDLSVSPSWFSEEPLLSSTPEIEEEVLSIWNQASKKMVLVGVCTPRTVAQRYLDQLAQDPSVVVMIETTSNWHHPHFINTIDSIITPFTTEDFEVFQPDVLLTLGGMIVSKRIKAFLRKYQPKHHWHVDALRAYDTFGCLTKHFTVTPQVFFEAFLSRTTYQPSQYNQYARAIRDRRMQKSQAYLSQVPFSDLKVFEIILAQIPKNSQLQISNSASIRYAQLFSIDSSIEVFSNRGTSGIDGSTSTAIGAAVGSPRPTICITGDIGFFYDSNALWNTYIPKNFKLILINNSGGGIFRILPGHQETEVFHTYFETTHQLNAEHLAKMYQFEYLAAHDIVSLQKGLSALWTHHESPMLLEVFTPTAMNNKILQEYFEALAD
ncbi:2-succinyl-5-enolpyruvyl-6-hydroxy-3-cyclohexene-1-carboxylic-acid synthase [Flavobacterium aciduliphilum]|uniref:2-succinyl-5-enolpyruvyl-6-hydroxy-3-cyclohexene-1-carboxylate synthase n=1 Tax=Flavobacterium aciduliphilum TaxID=1101402 RepID=A0A328Y882_9FLAO|nr:2-succinyl-5-enolpyruvyl-6-hydroxy-3-cyclohexene-1-carboxylic-acid synthase [Flavobacterium aciduliphilum]RAR70119.1 2-succinyl-5-enolpyruvyl-6-hydroxy-3-cyclohexene-1-carboxylate synthase [Flavobacterium aciduliphilum]